jgi:hypothetical protein
MSTNLPPYPVDPTNAPPYPPQPSNIAGGWTYDPNTNFQIFAIRSMIPDTDVTHPIFTDDELNFYLNQTGSMGIYTSSQNNPTGSNIGQPINQYDYYYAAALAIDVIASSKARLAVITSMLDVKLSAKDVQAALHAQAESMRARSDESGAFAIAEMVQDQFSARERTWKVWQRLLGP